MHPRDLWVHRIVGAAVVGLVLLVLAEHGIAMASTVLLGSGLPVAVLSAADRRYYGPPRRKDES